MSNRYLMLSTKGAIAGIFVFVFILLSLVEYMTVGLTDKCFMFIILTCFLQLIRLQECIVAMYSELHKDENEVCKDENV